ncbi:hypothetical protein [Thioclava sp. IC9]|uniref:hypothetical protein n=1 Tax=Thioclava sp. IC9 TaxID=1973007 RepID=UPI000B544BD5|nr:hypothetical protein [Thioclava sp. IC9]OWY04501.1 hypothetical protein B6V76_08270 [Thioclava sp. IC9]
MDIKVLGIDLGKTVNRHAILGVTSIWCSWFFAALHSGNLRGRLPMACGMDRRAFLPGGLKVERMSWLTIGR